MSTPQCNCSISPNQFKGSLVEKCKSLISSFKMHLKYLSTTTRSKIIEKKIKKDKPIFELSMSAVSCYDPSEYIWHLYIKAGQLRKLFINLLNDIDNKLLILINNNNTDKLKTFSLYGNEECIDKIQHLIIFINELLQEEKVKENNFVLELLEISCHSFDCFNGGKKPFEGFILKNAKFTLCRCIAKYLCCCIKCCCCAKCQEWHKRWFVLKDDMLCYFDNLDDTLGKDIFWFDQENTLTEPDSKFSFFIKNNSRSMVLKFTNEFDCLLWHKEIKARIEAIKSDENVASGNNMVYSFSTMKEKNKVNFFIDGKDYFSHLYHKLKTAKESVFIAGWWLSPELHLLRPGDDSTILKNILLKLAKKGVKVYILIYKEMSLALSLDSRHTKKSLVPLHENIKVTRHPKGKFELLWTHHEKMVIIDQLYGYIGGIDLCWGRYDTNDHVLCERLKRGQKTHFPGIDYSNARIKDFNDVAHPDHDDIARNTTPRMPWHDIQCYIEGPSIFDLTRHFVERWNFARSIEPEYKIVTGVRSSNVSNTNNNMRLSENACLITNYPSKGNNYHTQTDQIFDSKEEFNESFILTKKTFVIEEEDECYTYDDIDKRKDKIASAHQTPTNSNRKETLFNSILSKASQVKSTVQNLFRMNTFNIGGKSDDDRDFINMKIASNTSTKSLQFQCDDSSKNIQVLRSASHWSVGLKSTQRSILDAYYYLINNSKHFIYIENQYFVSRPYSQDDLNEAQSLQFLEEIHNRISEYIYNRILKAHDNKEKFRVIIFLPLLPGFPGEIGYSPTLQEIMKYTYASICRSSGYSLIEKLYKKIGVKWEDYIAFFSLRTHGLLNETPVTEIIYIHSKLMIVDDDYVIIGSANINDRSLKGSRDSEIALMITDENKVISEMNDVESPVSCFAKQLRMKLMKEHLGCLITDKHCKSELFHDPLNEELFTIMKLLANRNTLSYRKIFNCYPDDLMVKFNQIPLKIDMTPEELEKIQIEYDKEAGNIIGNIVEFPLHFLENEVLGRPLFCKETLVPIKNFT